MFVRAQIMRNGEQELARAGVGLLVMPSVASNATDSNQTYTVAQILGGVILRTTAANRTDTTPTGTALGAALTGMDIGDTFMFKVSSQAAYTITVAGGTGVTASGNLVVPASSAKDFILTKTSATTFTLVGL